MEERIGKKITETVGDAIPLYLYEGESDAYPYAVYLYEPEYHRTKDGVYKITADVTVQVYSNDFDEALEAADSIRDLLDAGMNGNGFSCDLQTTRKECEEDVWDIEAVYRINQYE